MRSSIKLAAILVAVAATAVTAQQPQPGPGGPPPNRPPMGQMGPGGGPMQPMQEGMGIPAAKMLLANSAELDLTDAQVVKLAAIARRGEARRRSMRAAMDSARQRFMPGQASDSAARRQFGDRMRADMQKMRDQAQTDQRDAIAVLTADQQAKAWDMIAARGMGARAGMRMGAMRGMGGGRMRAPGVNRGMRPGAQMRPRVMRPRGREE